MESRRIVIIGAGVAGLAAASRLKERGAFPILLSTGIGAGAMTSGACDLTPWTHSERRLPSEEAIFFARALGVFEQPGLVATTEGVVRPTDLVGARVLNLKNLRGKTIGIANFPRDDFRPTALAHQLNESEWACSSNTHFEVVSLADVVSEKELRFPLPAFQRIFDDPKRLVSLRDSLRSLSSKVQALLMGPWLGEENTLIESSGIIVGETLSPPEGAFGRRFERAAREFCSALGLEVRAERVLHIEQEDEGLRLSLQGQDRGRGSALWADGVVVATGGLVGHGVGVFAPPNEPTDLRVPLDPAVPLFGGAKEGWDAAGDGGRWVTPPHDRRVPWAAPGSHILFAGDVRRKVSDSAPGGTLLGAIQSGLDAAEALFF